MEAPKAAKAAMRAQPATARSMPPESGAKFFQVETVDLATADETEEESSAAFIFQSNESLYAGKNEIKKTSLRNKSKNEK